MRIVLIEPGLGEGGFNSFGKAHGTSFISHGLSSISAYAKSKGYNDIIYIDLRKLMGWEDFREMVMSIRPDIVGITMMSCDFNIAMKTAQIIKEENPNTKVIVGGVHPTVATEEVADREEVDYIIVGEGEISFVRLLETIEDGNNSERIITGEKPNLDDLPFEDRELSPDYSVSIQFPNFPGIFNSPMVSIIASRGCPFHCRFCAPHAQTMFGKTVRYRGVDHVIEEIKMLYEKYRFNSIQFVDYTVTLNPNWIEEFCSKYKTLGIKAQIWANSRADLICKNEQAIKKMSQIGLKMIAVGFESGAQRVLDFLKKGTTVEENLEAARICKKYGILVRGLFMLGCPTETKQEAKATIALIRKMKPDIYSFSYFTPMPGSFLYEYCKERNLSLIKNHDELAIMSPTLPKIKGIDYKYLNRLVEQAMGYVFGGKIFGKVARFFMVASRRKRMLWLRHFLVYCYGKLVQNKLYKALKSK